MFGLDPTETQWDIIWGVGLVALPLLWFAFWERLAVLLDRKHQDSPEPHRGRTFSAQHRGLLHDKHPLVKIVSGLAYLGLVGWYFVHIWFPEVGV